MYSDIFVVARQRKISSARLKEVIWATRLWPPLHCQGFVMCFAFFNLHLSVTNCLDFLRWMMTCFELNFYHKCLLFFIHTPLCYAPCSMLLYCQWNHLLCLLVNWILPGLFFPLNENVCPSDGMKKKELKLERSKEIETRSLLSCQNSCGKFYQ